MQNNSLSLKEIINNLKDTKQNNKFFKIENNSEQSGVFPVPPK